MGSAVEDNKNFMGFRRIATTFLLSILLILVSALAVTGQDNGLRGEAETQDPLLAEARDLSENGKFPEAAEAYTRWLAENGGHPRFGLILIEAADSQLSVERALELLRVYTPRVQDPEQRELCRASQIDLLEMLGRTEQALGLLRSFPPTPRWLYRQARLLYQEGLIEEAGNSLQQALKALLSDDTGQIGKKVEQNSELEARIRLLQARIFVVQKRDKEAENLFRLLTAKYGDTALEPGILLAYYEYLQTQGRNEAAETQLETLARKFPDSPEYVLAQAGKGGKGGKGGNSGITTGTNGGEGKIGYAPIPSRLLPRDLSSPGEGSGSEQSRERPEVQPGAKPEAAPRQPAVTEEKVEERPPTAAQSPAESRPAAREKTPAQVQPPVDVQRPAESEPSADDQPPAPNALVQTGSFRDRENAAYMVRDLEAAGFEAEIAEKRIGSTLYYRVVIGPLMTVEQAQAVLMKLKDASFEGVLLFPE